MSCLTMRAFDMSSCLGHELTKCFRGVMWAPTELLTADGYDLQFGTNVVGKRSLHPSSR